jgi:hypothetical protein
MNIIQQDYLPAMAITLEKGMMADDPLHLHSSPLLSLLIYDDNDHRVW